VYLKIRLQNFKEQLVFGYLLRLRLLFALLVTYLVLCSVFFSCIIFISFSYIFFLVFFLSFLCFLFVCLFTAAQCKIFLFACQKIFVDFCAPSPPFAICLAKVLVVPAMLLQSSSSSASTSCCLFVVVASFLVLLLSRFASRLLPRRQHLMLLHIMNAGRPRILPHPLLQHHPSTATIFCTIDSRHTKQNKNWQSEKNCTIDRRRRRMSRDGKEKEWERK